MVSLFVVQVVVIMVIRTVLLICCLYLYDRSTLFSAEYQELVQRFPLVLYVSVLIWLDVDVSCFVDIFARLEF